MAWGNAVLSENQNDVEACLTERGYQADISTRVTAESTSSALFSTVASRGRQALRGKGVNDGFARIIGASEALREVLDLVRIVAPTDSTALIEGETGTGKELIARAIHEHSSRRDRSFVKLNCAGHSPGALRERTLRPRKRSVHGRRGVQSGPFRNR